MKKEKFTAIILARGGSKGIKNKNLVKINKKPLIYWSIKACLNSRLINSVWVSSDNIKILNYSKKCGAKIILRPKKYAKDNSTSEIAWLHAIKFLNKQNIIPINLVGVQPTSPIRKKNDIDNACKKFLENSCDSLFSATAILDRFTWKKKNNKLISNYNYSRRPRRQDISKKYLENGSFYIFNKNKFIKKKCRLFGKISFHLMSKINSFQIDDNDDIKIVNSLKNFF